LYAEIINDHKAIAKLKDAYLPIPAVRKIDEGMVARNYAHIRQEALEIAESEIERIFQDPTLRHLIIQKNNS